MLVYPLLVWIIAVSLWRMAARAWALALSQELDGQAGVDAGGIDDVVDADLIVDGVGVTLFPRAKADGGDVGEAGGGGAVGGKGPIAEAGPIVEGLAEAGG